jgi:nitrite reductase (NADH) small subunit
VTRWIRICATVEAPKSGEAIEADAGGTAICLANLDGELSALDNWCPHRRGPLGQGWIDGASIVCPWHSWAFNLKTGISEPPVQERVAVFPVRVEEDDVLVQIAEMGEIEDQS